MTAALPVIGFAGMTHLGLNSAVAAAEKGFSLIAFDPDPSLIGRLENGDLPVVEPDLPEFVAKNRDRLSFSAKVEALSRCDVVYIAPDVPTDDQGGSNLASIEALLAIVLPTLKPGTTLVILSQVPPGFARARGRLGIPLYYQVETLIFGRAMERALYPERFIIGCAEPGRPLPAAYRRFLESFGCPLLPMRYESAELAKIAINCFLVSSVTTANTLAELCEGIGADWREIVPALRLDRRIGEHAYLGAGLGIAGGNLERDLATVIRFAERVGSDAGVVRAWIANSRHRKDWAAGTVKSAVLAPKPDALVAILGLAYKENTHSIKNSPAIACLKALEGCNLAVYDPVVDGRSVVPFARTCASALACATGADALALLTPWAEFKTLEPSALAGVMRGRVIIDPYRCLAEDKALVAGFEYISLGTPMRRVGAKGRA